MAVGLTLLDVGTSGDGSAAKKVVTESVETALVKAAEHAANKNHYIGKTVEEITDIAKDVYKNFDIKATIKDVKKYFYNSKTNDLLINNSSNPTIFKPSRGINYLKEAIKKDINKLKNK